METYVFLATCSARWQPLRAAVGADPGEVVADMTIDGQRVLDLVFAGYGQVCAIPINDLVEAGP